MAIYKNYLLAIIAASILLNTGCLPKATTGGQIEPPIAAELQRPETPKAAEPTDQNHPTIVFERIEYDFGDIGPQTKSIGEFKFTNTGTALLNITSVEKTCGCTPFTLEKTEYAPSESGTLKFEYHSGGSRGKTVKHIFVNTNDSQNQKVSLTIKANIVLKVEIKPEKLELSLRAENGGAGKITLSCIDNKPFAIKNFQSTDDVVSAETNPELQATEFVLAPKADLAKLKEHLTGRIFIYLTHPECEQVSIEYSAMPEFESTPKAIIISNAEPLKKIEKQIYIKSNYGDKIEIESTSSQKGTIKLIGQEDLPNSAKLNLEITPPAITANLLFFADSFYVKLKGFEQIEINCRGFYSTRDKTNTK